MNYFLCLNPNVFSFGFIKHHDPEAAKVLSIWADISKQRADDFYVVLVGAGTGVVFYKDLDNEPRAVFIMTDDPKAPVETFAKNLLTPENHHPLVDHNTLYGNNGYISIFGDERYGSTGSFHLTKFIGDELAKVVSSYKSNENSVMDIIHYRLSNFGISLSLQTKLLDNHGELVVVDEGQGFVVSNLAAYFSPEEYASFRDPQGHRPRPANIDALPVRYDFIISLTKNNCPDIPQWVPHNKTTDNVESQREETNMKNSLKNDKVTQTLLSSMVDLDVPEQLLKPVVVSHEVPDHVAGQKIIALQNCLHTTKPEITLETILDGIKARYEAMEQPIAVVYAYRVSLHKVKVYGGEGVCLFNVIHDRDTSEPKPLITCKDEDFFFKEEKEKIGEWLINNYYGVC